MFAQKTKSQNSLNGGMRTFFFAFSLLFLLALVCFIFGCGERADEKDKNKETEAETTASDLPSNLPSDSSSDFSSDAADQTENPDTADSAEETTQEEEKKAMTLDPVDGVTLPSQSTTFSWKLANQLLVLASGNTQEEAATLFEAAGFTVVLHKNFDKDPADRSHTSAYTVGTQQISYRGQTRTAVLIAIRGTNAGEWYSNMDFDPDRTGDPAFAENFMRAAQDVFDGIKQVTDGIAQPLYLVTGYSRGAACANLTGYLLNAYNGGVDDSFVYAFACPTTVRKDPAVACDNIFNFVNPADCVTETPLASLGFHRLGTDIVLPGNQALTQSVQSLVSALQVLSPSISSYYNDKRSLTGAGLSEDGMTGYEAGEMLAGMFAAASSSSSASVPSFPFATVSPESDFYPFAQYMLALMMGSLSDPETAAQLSVQHNPQTYLALMNQLYLEAE